MVKRREPPQGWGDGPTPGDDAAARLGFTLILRLPDAAQPPSAWATWTHAADLLGVAATESPEHWTPYKRYPIGGHAYFAEHVGRALFPPVGTSRGGRWLHRPVQHRLRVRAAHGEVYDLSIDLLELVKFDVAPHLAFGLVHLACAGQPSAQEMLECSAALHERYREPSTVDEPALEITVAGQIHGKQVMSREPLAALAELLFGSAHPTLSRRAWVCVVAQRPAEIVEEDAGAWRRGLARGFSLVDAAAAIRNNPERNEHQTVRLGPFTGLILGRSAAFTSDEMPAAGLYNVRSYWGETLLLAIAQHDYLESFATELAALGQDPLGHRVDELYVRWLGFRNALGWSYLSTTSDVPQRLLKHAHVGLGTEPLREELEQSFATYVAQRQRLSDDAEEAALAALQVYGAVFAAVGTVAAALQVIGDGLFDHWPSRIGVLAALALLGAAVYLLMRRRVRSR